VFRDDEARLERYPSMYVLRQGLRSSGATGDEESASSDSTPPDPEQDVSDVAVETAEQPDDGIEALTPDA
jgi:hypothetical protein